MVTTHLGTLADCPIGSLPLLEVCVSPWPIISPTPLTPALPAVNPLKEG
jgi:hypothetical protein